MTGIVGLVDGDTVWIGGDSAAVERSHYLTLDAQPKVFVNGPCLFGFTSSFAMGRALQYVLDVPALPACLSIESLDRWVSTDFADEVRKAQSKVGYLKTENGRVQGGQFLLGVRGALYVFDDDFHARRPRHGFAAIGSGVSVSQGALFASQFDEPQARIVTALQAAEQFTTTVRGPFTVMQMTVDGEAR